MYVNQIPQNPGRGFRKINISSNVNVLLLTFQSGAYVVVVNVFLHSILGT